MTLSTIHTLQSHIKGYEKEAYNLILEEQPLPKELKKKLKRTLLKRKIRNKKLINQLYKYECRSYSTFSSQGFSMQRSDEDWEQYNKKMEMLDKYEIKLTFGSGFSTSYIKDPFKLPDFNKTEEQCKIIKIHTILDKYAIPWQIIEYEDNSNNIENSDGNFEDLDDDFEDFLKELDEALDEEFNIDYTQLKFESDKFKFEFEKEAEFLIMHDKPLPKELEQKLLDTLEERKARNEARYTSHKQTQTPADKLFYKLINSNSKLVGPSLLIIVVSLLLPVNSLFNIIKHIRTEIKHKK